MGEIVKFPSPRARADPGFARRGCRAGSLCSDAPVMTVGGAGTMRALPRPLFSALINSENSENIEVPACHCPGKSPATRVKNQISTWIFHKLALSSFEQVPQAIDLLNNKQMVQAMGSSLHNLVADRFGDAMVVETGEIGNQITEIQDR